MPFSSPTSLLPPLPSAPPTLQSPIFRAQSGNGSGSSSSSSQDTAGRVNQSHVPSCCRYPPPPFPPAQQRNRFPFPQPTPPPSTPTPTTKSSTITENLQTAGNNPYLQQFPRIPLDQNEHERLNQMFYANVLRPPPTMQPPNSMHSQQQPQQPPSTPTPTKRTRKRKSSPEKCPSVLSKSSDISQQQNNNQSSTFPITPNMQQTNNGPILSSAAELFQPQEESEERLINVIQNPNVTIEENNNNNGNVDHDSDDVIIIEHNQGEPNPSRLRTPSLETPPPKLCIADNEGEEEEDENEEPPPSKTRALTFSKSAIPPPNLSTLSSEASPLTTTSSPSTSESSPSPDITFNLETIKEFCEAHFIDKPMLKGYYKILQENRPKDLPKYLSTIGFAHNLQDSKKTMDNFFEFGKSNVSKLLAQAKQDPPKCSKCREMDVPLPETLITYLEEVEKSSSSNSDEIAKHALLKVIKFTCDALSNAMEKIFNSTKFCIGTSNPPPITKEVRNAVESAFKSADNYEKCSIIWNSEPLKNIKIGVAEEFYRLRILSVSLI
uniref:Uncharacterized protein n=1 Tax=Panagrolaimus sp. PS1159 TaxID=55785 RepID=A0AC35FHW7_9BILA